MVITEESNNMPLIWEMAREKEKEMQKVPKALLDFMGYVFFFWSREVDKSFPPLDNPTSSLLRYRV